MSKLNCANRHFSIFSDIRNCIRCFVVYDDSIDALSPAAIMDKISETDNLSALAYFRKPFFMVDTQIFRDCIVFEVAFKGTSTTLDLMNFEAIAAAEMTCLFDKLSEEYGARSN